MLLFAFDFAFVFVFIFLCDFLLFFLLVSFFVIRFQFLIYSMSATATSYVNAGYASVEAAPMRGGKAVLPKWVEVNLMKLVLACSDRGDRNAGDLKVRSAVGHYIKGTGFERDFKERYPGAWNQSEQIVIPGFTHLIT